MVANGQPTAYDTSGLSDLITDGVRLREILPILNKYLQQQHGCVIMPRFHFFCGVLDMRAGTRGKTLFKHVSLAACLEFALKQEP